MSTFVRDLGLLFYIVPIAPESGNYASADDVPDYISRAVPFFLLLIVLECIYGWVRSYKLYSLKDTVMSISLGIVQQLVGVWMKEAQILPYLVIYDLFAPLRALVLQSPYWPDLTGDQYQVLIFIVGFLGCDLGYYFLHRTAHEWQLLWSAHSVHHSGERYNFATALRQGIFQSCYSWCFYIWLAALGLPVTHFIRHNRLNTVYQFWIHTEIVGRCPWLIELFMNTPSHHRPHHRPPGNCNYAGVLIIWDRLFCSKDDEHVSITSRGVIYGLAKPLDNYDPVYANMSHMVRIAAPKCVSGDTSEGNAAWLLSRSWAVLQVVVSKRIRQTLRVTLAPHEFMPDILADWEIQRQCVRTCNPLTYLHHLWNELWALPPPVDESGLSEKIVLATNVPGVGNTQAEFSHRDKVFLLGRQAPTMLHNNTTPQEDGVLMANGALVGGLNVFGGAQGENVIKLGMALICVMCVLSLQSIKLYYK
eukprot:gene18123-20639_t